jgi:hypothetical protein
MASISDEASFKQAIGALPLEQQRKLGALFIHRVLDLVDDSRLRLALEQAESDTPNESALLDAYRSAKNIEVNSYAICGHEADWRTMAAHHVAAGIAAIVAPESAIVSGVDIPAYSAATSARMAILASSIAEGKEFLCNENEEQYKIAAAFLEG